MWSKSTSSVVIFIVTVLLVGLTACQSTPASRAWQWQRAEVGLPRQSIIVAVAVDPQNPDRIWAGNYAPGGLASSTDGGQSWSVGAEGLGDNPVFDLLPMISTDAPPATSERTDEVSLLNEVDPSLRLWAATRDGLMGSDDAGARWQLVSDDLPAAAVFSLAADASGRLYLGLDNHGVYVQEAKSWRSLSLDQALAESAVLSLAVAPDGQQIYAGTADRGVFASRDAGESWQQAFDDDYAANVALNPTDPTVVVASLRDRLVRTEDGGQSWQVLSGPWGSDQVVSLLWPVDGSLGIGTASGHLYRSPDGGDSWMGGGSNLPSSGVMDLAWIDDQHLLAGTWRGLYASGDGGQSWQSLAPSLGEPHPNALLATNNGLFLGTQSGLFRWQPEERQWVAAPFQFPSGIASMAAHPQNPDILYAGTSSDGVFRSDDAGQSWTQLPSRLFGVPALAIDPNNPDLIYLLAAWERVYESRNGGQSWSARWEGMGNVTETISLMVDPADSAIYAGTEYGLYRNQGSEPWDLIAPSLVDQSVLALLAQPAGERSTLYIGVTRGVYRSLDRGDTIDGLDRNLTWGSGLKDISVTALVADPADSQRLYAGTAYAGVFETRDGGQSWQPIGPDMPVDAVVESLAWGPNGELFVAAASGVWVGNEQ